MRIDVDHEQEQQTNISDATPDNSVHCPGQKPDYGDSCSSDTAPCVYTTVACDCPVTWSCECADGVWNCGLADFGNDCICADAGTPDTPDTDTSPGVPDAGTTPGVPDAGTDVPSVPDAGTTPGVPDAGTDVPSVPDAGTTPGVPDAGTDVPPFPNSEAQVLFADTVAPILTATCGGGFCHVDVAPVFLGDTVEATYSLVTEHPLILFLDLSYSGSIFERKITEVHYGQSVDAAQIAAIEKWLGAESP